MNEQILKLSKDFFFPAIDYAGQGNAVLGIRDAGKTYTAMKAAEGLLDCGIPIVVYDPVGVWKNLKVGTGNNIGYQIVVAGGADADIRLTKSNAVDIVRAAMKENISIVIDLYSPELINKSTWISIVQETVDVLMYENKSYGLRHIFIEEAAEFIPQRLQPQHSKVYASLERLARMGRNARLGYTLINQRAEEVNKAILEISALILLHKQVGKNSLKSIQQWFELLQIDNTKEVIKSLPSLKQGQCWAIGQTLQPKLLQVDVRKTFHPNPKQSHNHDDVKVNPTNVSEFVNKLQKLITVEAPVVAKTIEPNKSSEQIKQLEKQITELKNENKRLTSLYDSATDIIKNISSQIDRFNNVPIESIKKTEPPVAKPSPTIVKHDLTKSKDLGKCAAAILQFLYQYNSRSFTKVQVGIATGYSPNSGGFNNALSELNSKGLIDRIAGSLTVTKSDEIEKYINPGDHLTYSIDTFKDKLSKCEREIYEVLLENPHSIFSKQLLAEQTESQYSSTSGGFNNALSTLNTLELIKRVNGQIQLNPELLEL